MNKLKLEKYNKLKDSFKESLKESDPLSSLKLKPDLNQGKKYRLSSLKLNPELDHGSDHVSLRIPVGKEHLKLKI